MRAVLFQVLAMIRREPLCWIALIVIGVPAGWAEDTPVGAGSTAYKKLSLEELMNVEVTSASKRPEKLSETASAIQAISGDDIHRSGATILPEALRLLPNLQVAQVNSSQWAISARGFNNTLANKMLVLIDGRAVYTPLYAGVFWDVQNVMLEDIDRIEAVSGPGGTLWGANAVNGVINVISKSARETQGTYASAGAGSFQQDFAAIRSGGTIAPDLFLRVYGQHFDRGNTLLANGQDAPDDWGMTQGGFRMDWEPGRDTVTLQGDLYEGNPDPDGGAPVAISGGNVLSRWSHTVSATSDFQLQVYYDRTMRDLGTGFAENLNTYDLDWQHRFQFGGFQEVIWGLGYRFMDDRTVNPATFAFDPPHRQLDVFSAFLQDEIVLIADRLRLVLGSKFERNDYTGFEYQPSGRLAWTPTEDQCIWGAISRAVRTPSRIDRDFSAAPFLVTNPDFESEKLLAYEVGWRFRPHELLALSVATFYNEYDDLRSVEPGPPFTLGNGVEGETYGVELTADSRIVDFWRLRGGYTFLKKNLRVKSDSQDLNQGTAESNDPRNQFLVQSTVDLPANFAFDSVVRYVDVLSDPHVSSYVELEVRLGCRPTEHLEFSLVGQNLLDHSHPEFTRSATAGEIPRSVYGSITVRW